MRLLGFINSKSALKKICADPAIGNLVIQMHQDRFTSIPNHSNNSTRLETARALLRLGWTLSTSIIPDFVNAITVGSSAAGGPPGSISIHELVLYYQCNHNDFFLGQIYPELNRRMEQCAQHYLPQMPVNLHEPAHLYTLVILYKGAGHSFAVDDHAAVLAKLSSFIDCGTLNAQSLHPDGRLMVGKS